MTLSEEMKKLQSYQLPPRVDIHLHLDGAITPAVALGLCQVQGISLGLSQKQLEGSLTVGNDCDSLKCFLRCFKLPLSLLQTETGLEEAVFRVLLEQQKHGIIYAELRFAPQLHTDRGLSQEQAIKAAVRGLERSKIPANLILCMMRGNDNGAQNLETLRLCRRFLTDEQGVAGLDLAGAEGLYPTSGYTELFSAAKDMKIPLTVHAGEAGGAEDVKIAVMSGARRIGHGVRAAGDRETVGLLKKEGVTLEMCPTSNRLTGAVCMSEYPLEYFMNEGVSVTVNTDDPAIEVTDIQKEFEYARRLSGIGRADERRLTENAICAAFASDGIKRELYAALDKNRHISV